MLFEIVSTHGNELLQLAIHDAKYNSILAGRSVDMLTDILFALHSYQLRSFHFLVSFRPGPKNPDSCVKFETDELVGLKPWSWRVDVQVFH